MSLGSMISAARKTKCMSQAQLGDVVGLAQNAISNIENDAIKTGLDPRTLIRIADALQAPELLIHHCESCPIRSHILLKLFPDLNNIRRDPAIIAARLRKEMVEGAAALERLSERFSDVNFRSRPDYLQLFETEMEQVIDVKRGIEILEFELLLSHACQREDLDRVYVRQQSKCEAHGHHVAEDLREAA